MANDNFDLQELAQSTARDLWGFVPGRNVKPVHFANGFFRALSGHTRQSVAEPDLIHEAAGGYRKGNSNFSTEQFIRDAEGQLMERSGAAVKPDDVRGLRAALDDVFSQDRALYASPNFWTLTLTHWRHVSSDTSDSSTGRFMAWLLAKIGPPETVDTLRRVLDDERDAFYELAAPLVDRRSEMQPVSARSEMNDLLGALAEAPPTQAVARGFARLARHAEDLEKTAFLQRVVALGGFGLHVHLVNSTTEGRAGRLAPMLLCARDPAPEVRDASRRTYARGKRRLIEAFEEALTRRLTSRGEDDNDRVGYVRLMKRLLFPGGQSDAQKRAAEDVMERFETDFDTERAAVGTDFEAFVRALRAACFTANKRKLGIGTKNPRKVLFFIGKHSGLLGPFRGPGEKYYRPEPQMLDALVVALLDPGEEGITEQDFWQRAYEEFGLISGARGKRDVRLLQEEWNVRGAGTDPLEANAEALRDQLARLGYARTYADGATLISANA